ncbi:MAG: ArsR/SmtB family transcription factor [Candidatus Aquicultorales bacterium]
MNAESCFVNVVHADKVAKAALTMYSDETAEKLAEAFKVLGDQTRVKIVSALLGEELCVCDISALIGMSQSAVSHQLGALRKERLVKRRREGQKAFYSLDDDHIKSLLMQCFEHVSEASGVTAGAESG